MNDRLHVHLPFRQVEKYLPLVKDRGLQPEIAFQGPELDRIQPDELARIGRIFQEKQLQLTVHGPFLDLNPGALEPLVTASTNRRYRQTMDAARCLGARLVVFHPGYEHWKYDGQMDLWLEASLKFWASLVTIAEDRGIVLALENVFETVPDPLSRLLNEIDSPWLGHCFDVGHWHLFSRTPLEQWLDILGARLVHMHLHDNRGDADSHLPVGMGNIDFFSLFKELRNRRLTPSMTLEAHSPDDLLLSLQGVEPFLS